MTNLIHGWIRHENGQANGERLLRLWKDEIRNVFIMDNHLAALFCWLGTLKSDERYRLFHIDHHWDMTDMEEEELDILQLNDFTDLARLDAFTNLSVMKSNVQFPLVNYTNYISPLPYLRPLLFNAVLGADQYKYDAEISHDPKFLLVTIKEFFETVKTFLDMPFAGRTLFNVDIDFFFSGMGVDAVRVYGDEYIEKLARLIKPAMNEQSVLTIALSPEFCGHDRAVEICSQFCDLLEIDHPF